jgi:hypothetical protein
MKAHRTLFCFGLLLATACGSGEEDLTHGYIEVVMTPAQNETAEVFAGTSRIIATVTYQTCLQTFYANESGWRQDGPDGAPVFGNDEGGEDWKTRLCDPAESGQIGCSVALIDQNLETSPPNLAITYDVTSFIEGQFIKVGPIPLQELAGCEGGQRPLVGIGGNVVSGLNGAGAKIWQVATFKPPEISPEDGGSVQVTVGRAGG